MKIFHHEKITIYSISKIIIVPVLQVAKLIGVWTAAYLNIAP